MEFLALRLTETEHRDVFLRFCTDIIAAVAAAESAQQAVDVCIMRTWRWHRLLKAGRDGRLTAEEQKGLIGELALMRRHVMPTMGVGEAVRSWVGPLGAQRDFEMGPASLESKACAPGGLAIRIASADQLHATETTPLALHVIEIADAISEAEGAVSVTDVVEDVRAHIESSDLSGHESFDERLWAVGYDPTDDYSDRRWIVGESTFFEVVDGFPRITPPMLPPGVDNVRYEVELAHCEQFRIDATKVFDIISGASR